MTATAVHEGHEAKAHHPSSASTSRAWSTLGAITPSRCCRSGDLGGLPADQPVLEINLEDNTERTLGECEVVHIKPGHAFCKKVRYKRG